MENEKELLQDEAAPAVEAEQTDVREETPAPETGKKGLFRRKKKKEKVKKTVGQEILSWVFTILAALAIAFVVRTFVFEFVKVDGESMDDTLADGEIMYVSKLSYGSRWLAMPWANAETQENSAKWTYFGNPQRFDVVICRYPGRGGTNFVKRVVGLPGDTVEIRDGYLYVNGEKYDEPYINDSYRFASGAELFTAVDLAEPVTARFSGSLVKKEADGTLTMLSQGYLIGQFAYQNGTLTVNGTAVSFNSETDKLFILNNHFSPLALTEDAEFTVADGAGVLLIRGEKSCKLAAKPGDTISIKDGSLTVNGEAVDAKGCILAGGTLANNGSYTVPEGNYFVMGDHRNNSNDSRAVGALERSYIMGKVKQVLWPLNQWKAIPNGLDVKGN